MQMVSKTRTLNAKIAVRHLFSQRPSRIFTSKRGSTTSLCDARLARMQKRREWRAEAEVVVEEEVSMIVEEDMIVVEEEEVEEFAMHTKKANVQEGARAVSLMKVEEAVVEAEAVAVGAGIEEVVGGAVAVVFVMPSRRVNVVAEVLADLAIIS